MMTGQVMTRALLAATLLFFAGSAYAADMPLKAPPAAPPAPTWTGWYIGINGGEYLHTAFASITGFGPIACTPGVGNCVGTGFRTTFQFSSRFTEDVGRVALSYKF
jgi:hypothetical protein